MADHELETSLNSTVNSRMGREHVHTHTHPAAAKQQHKGTKYAKGEDGSGFLSHWSTFLKSIKKNKTKKTWLGEMAQWL